MKLLSASSAFASICSLLALRSCSSENSTQDNIAATQLPKYSGNLRREHFLGSQISDVPPRSLPSRDIASAMLHQAGTKIEDDASSLEALFRLCSRRVAHQKEQSTDSPIVSSYQVYDVAQKSLRSVSRPMPNLSADDIFRSVEKHMRQARQHVLSGKNPQENLFVPLWEKSNAHDTTVDCGTTKCELVMRNVATDKTFSVVIDASGNSAGNTKGAGAIFSKDAKKVQEVLATLASVHRSVEEYNKQATSMTVEGTETPTLNFFIEAIKSTAGIHFPVWTWNYNFRAYVQLAIDDNRLAQVSVPVEGLWNSAAFRNAALVPFEWSPTDDKLPIGHKRISAFRLHYDFRSTTEAEQADAWPILSEGFFRTFHKMLYRDVSEDDEVNEQPQDAQELDDELSEFVTVKQPMMQRELQWGATDAESVELKTSLVWSANFPVSATFVEIDA